MSIAKLNEVLRNATSSESAVNDPAGTKSLDEVLLSDLYADRFEDGRTTTGYITIVNGPGATLDPGCTYGSTCNANTNCLCASAAEDETALPVRFEL